MGASSFPQGNFLSGSVHRQMNVADQYESNMLQRERDLMKAGELKMLQDERRLLQQERMQMKQQELRLLEQRQNRQQRQHANSKLGDSRSLTSASSLKSTSRRSLPIYMLDDSKSPQRLIKRKSFNSNKPPVKSPPKPIVAKKRLYCNLF